MVDKFKNIVRDEHISDIAEAIREVMMIPDDMTVLDMPDKILLAKEALVDGGSFTEPETGTIFQGGGFDEDDNLVFDSKGFKEEKRNGKKNTD